MASASPPKPWEVRKVSPANSAVPVSSTVARSALEPDSATVGLPAETGPNPHIGGNRSPQLPPRPGQSSLIGNSYGSGYNSPYNRYGSSYGGGYGSSYGSGYGGSGYGGSGYGGYGSGGYGSGGYGSSYGSGYGGYGSGGYGRYGSSYGGYGSTYGASSYGGGYGGYGSSYGGYGAPNNGRYGGTQGPPEGPFQNMLDGGYNQINRFGTLVEGFSRFSRLLDANFDALHGSFASVIRLLDVFGEFSYVVSTFAVFKLLFGGAGRAWQAILWFLGRRTNQTGTGKSEGNVIGVEDYKDFQSRQRSYPTLFVLLGIICVSLPLLLVRMWRAARTALASIEAQNPPRELEDVWKAEPATVRAKYSFVGENDVELPFREGDLIRLLGKPFPEWWEGELRGRRGLFPSNYVEPVVVETTT